MTTPSATARELRPTFSVSESFTAEYLGYYRMLPLELTDECLRVAVAGEPHADAIDDLRSSFGRPVELVPVDAEELSHAIRRTFAASESVVDLVRGLSEEPGALPLGLDESTADIRDLVNQAPVVRFVNLLMREAHEAAASDVHLEATGDGLRVRMRIDGVLSELPRPPRSLQAAIISRIKLLAELDIAERRRPQDGRIRVRLEERELDLRVSSVPTMHGESLVLRLLDRGGRAIGLDELGLAPADLVVFTGIARRAHGIVLATGPTGSGKTTTLYAALGLRDSSQEKIITIEDPIEYQLPSVTQMPVHATAGVTFAAALRSILRQDPDVLMVGEMRDGETAAIAVQAAMTGHLVFSTLHTNDAAAALTRVSPMVFRNVGDAKVVATRSQVEILGLALDAYRLDNDYYPSTAQGLAALRQEPAGDPTARNWRGPYLKKELPLDPYGRPCLYQSPGENNPGSYDLVSLGRDGQPGGTGEDADITSWQAAGR